jgi:hypothetical protein
MNKNEGEISVERNIFAYVSTQSVCFRLLLSTGILGCPLKTYKPPGSTFNLIRKHVPLKKVVSWLKRGQ